MRVGPRKRTVRYVEEADGTRLRVVERRQCSTLDDFVGAVENLCIVRARGGPAGLAKAFETESSLN